MTEINYRAFEGCSSIKTINIPESVTKIEFAAFEGCSSLEAIDIPEIIYEIGSYAFDKSCAHLSFRIKYYDPASFPNYIFHNRHITNSYLLTFLDPQDPKHLLEIPFSRDIGFRGKTIDEVVKNLDQSFEFESAYFKPLIAFFRVRSNYLLGDLARATYLRYLKSKVEIVARDLLYREGAESLYLLVEMGILNKNNIERLVDKLLIDSDVETKASLFNIKAQIKDSSRAQNKYKL